MLRSVKAAMADPIAPDAHPEAYESGNTTSVSN
jgi:hypothetical protein